MEAGIHLLTFSSYERRPPAQMRTNKEKGGEVLESTYQKEAATQL